MILGCAVQIGGVLQLPWVLMVIIVIIAAITVIKNSNSGNSNVSNSKPGAPYAGYVIEGSSHLGPKPYKLKP